MANEEVKKEEEKKEAPSKTYGELPKSKFAAGMLAVYPSGAFGASDIYLGKKTWLVKLIVSCASLVLYAILSIVGSALSFIGIGLLISLLQYICVIPLLGMYIWSAIEGILIFTGKTTKDGNGVEFEPDTQKSRYAAYVLGRWCGYGGAHNFYLGNKTNAIIQACVGGACFVLYWVPVIGDIFFLGLIGMEVWGFIEANNIINGVVKTDAAGNPLKF